MISQIFFTNLILIVSALFIDMTFKLNLEKTTLNPILCAWAVMTGLSFILYPIYLVWS